MTKQKSKCLLSLLLSLAMVFSLTATPVFAAETENGTTEAIVEESTGETTGASEESQDSIVDENEETDEAEPLLTVTSDDSDENVSEDDEAFSAEDVQSMIDALPEASEITSENASEVEAQLDAIDEARVQIGEDADYLDYTKYDEACAALEALYSVQNTSTDDATEEIDELVPDVELPEGAERSKKVAASDSAVSIDDTSNVSYNGNTYSTVSAAIDAIQTRGTITLTGDVSETSITIPSGKNITLNLGGYTLTLTGGTTYTDTGYTGSTFRASLVNQGTLTIQNGSLVGNGTYTTDNTNYYVQNMILNTGTLDIESGVTVTGKLYTITNVGGTVTTAGDITATYYDAIVTYGGAITVDDGTITATNSSYYGSAIDIFDRNYNRPTSDDGTGATVTIKNGTIKAYCYGFSTNNQLSGYSNLNIYGGTIETVYACIYWPTPGTITIGKEESTSDATPYLKNTGGSGIVICCGTLKVYSGTIEATYAATESTPFDSTTWAANYRTSSGMVGLADAISVIANRSSAYAEYSLEIDLEGGTYISASNYAVRYLNCNAASDSDTDTSQNISVELSGGTYTGGKTTNGEAVAAIDTCEYEDTSKISTLTVTGGSYSSDISEYTTSTSAAVANGDGTYSVVETVENAVAAAYKADGTLAGTYTSLDGAYKATPDGGKLVLLADISAPESGNTLSIYRAWTITLDLNGHQLAGSSIAIFVSAAANMTILDSAGGGKVTGAGGSGLVRATAGTVTIENGTYEATSGNVLKTSDSSAKIIVNGGTFTSTSSDVINNGGGAIVINGGTFTASTSGKTIVGLSATTEDVSVKIYDGTFSGSISYNYEGVGYAKDAENLNAGDIVISGGKYYGTSDWLLNSYLADGYAATSSTDENGTTYYTVGSMTAVLTYTSDGTEVTKGCASVQVAVNAVAELSDASNIKITMYDDCDSRVTITSGEFTLDLNGYAITSDTSDGIALLVSGGTVTVTDNSEDQTGTVTMNSENDNGSALVRVTGGTVTLTNGHYKSDFNQGIAGVNSGASLTITGGYFTSNPSNYVAEGYVAAKIDDETYSYAVLSVALGSSGNDSTKVTATSISGYGTNTLYVGVSASDISNYSTEKYPTTSLTYTSDSSVDSGSYIFAGWYTLDGETYTACSSNMWDSTTEKAETYYAKFVDANVLSVQCAFTYDVSEYGNIWRFLSSMDTKDFTDFSFTVLSSSGETVYTTEHAKRYPTSYTVTGVNHTFNATDFSSASKYVITDYYADSTEALTTCKVYGSWMTADGTVVSGATYTFTQSSQTAVLTAQTEE